MVMCGPDDSLNDHTINKPNTSNFSLSHLFRNRLLVIIENPLKINSQIQLVAVQRPVSYPSEFINKIASRRGNVNLDNNYASPQIRHYYYRIPPIIICYYTLMYGSLPQMHGFKNSPREFHNSHFSKIIFILTNRKSSSDCGHLQ